MAPFEYGQFESPDQRGFNTKKPTIVRLLFGSHETSPII